MTRLAAEIERMFGDESSRHDPSGTLGVLLERAQAWDARSAFILDADGRVLSCSGEELRSSDRPLVVSLPNSSVPQLSDLRGNLEGVAFLVSVRGAEGGLRHVGILLDVPCLTTPDPDEFSPLARLTYKAWEYSSHCRAEQARNRHLLVERETLKTAHSRIVAEVLEEREQYLREKRRHIDELETEVRRRSAALQEAMERAEAANRAKSEFLANMSHEIRTPMTAILGYAENLLDTSLPNDERVSAANVIRRNGEHLLNLINDILDLSKIEAGRLNSEFLECSPGQIVAEVYGLMAVRAESKNLEWNVEFRGPMPETVRTDPMRLRQILINLVGNALKFTHEGSVRLVVSLDESPSHGDTPAEPRLRFEVIDSGIGMTPQQLAALFQPFTQADNSTTRQYGGTGLGLTISKRLANALGGDLTATAHPGEGSTFVLTIRTGPLDRVRMIEPASLDDFPARGIAALATRPAPSRQTHISLDGVHVLLAEDGPDNQRLVAFLLRKAGAEVTVAENGQIALDQAIGAAALGEPFDVILMDMQMPVLDGYEATRRLRELGHEEPIIALTAHAMAGNREKCLDAGCTDFATKPIDRRGLLETIRRYARQSK